MNPIRTALPSSDSSTHTIAPAIFVIFGITGDLAQRRLLPALYHLLKDNLLNEHTEIVGISRHDVNIDEFLSRVELCVLEADDVCDPIIMRKFKKCLRMMQLDSVNATEYDTLRITLDNIEDTHGVCMNRLFYLSIPPQVYEPIIKNLGEHKLNAGCKHGTTESRLLVEKPFGYDLASAQDLISRTEPHFPEEQIFRIDHYLAKETVQNIVVFREQNPIFASLWNNKHISKIAIDMHEQIGIEGRGAFYDNIGALRDVVQNHLLQLLALVTMDIPAVSTENSTLHIAKQKLLTTVEPVGVQTGRVRRGQYVGYREAVKNIDSTTETYVSLPLHINNDTWRHVPITITAGKALSSKKTTVTLTFTSPHTPNMTNTLSFRIQPNEGINIELTVKRPGFDERIEIVDMDFSYRGVFNTPEHPDAYERVLVDAVRGDHSLFVTSKEVLAAWRILQPVLDAWEQDSSDLEMYEQGSDGPSPLSQV